MSRKCVEHLRRQEYAALDLLLVDNGSTDGSADRFAEWGLRPEEFLALPANLGFASGMNAGLKVAHEQRYDYAWILNNDAFVETDCLSLLVERMEARPSAGIASPRLVGDRCDDPMFGARIDWERMRIDYLRADEVPALVPSQTWYMGAALLARMECLSQVGDFDDRFFAYHEDSDLCLRCQRAGWDLLYVEKAICSHLGGATSGGGMSPFVAYMMSRNAWMFLKKALPRQRYPLAFCRLAAESLRQAAAFLGHGNHSAATAQVAGLLAALRGEVGPPKALMANSFLERFLVNHSWGVSVWLSRLSRLFPRQAPHLAFPINRDNT